LWPFFFSRRRRHTRSKRDWSSDVCSSDLEAEGDPQRRDVVDPAGAEAQHAPPDILDRGHCGHGSPSGWARPSSLFPLARCSRTLGAPHSHRGTAAAPPAHGRLPLPPFPTVRPPSDLLLTGASMTVPEHIPAPRAGGAGLIETAGIEIIAESERTARPRDLFWPWFAANVSVFGLSYGSW